MTGGCQYWHCIDRGAYWPSIELCNHHRERQREGEGNQGRVDGSSEMPAASAYESSASQCEELIGLLYEFSVYIPDNRLNLRIRFKSVTKSAVDDGAT